MKIQLLETFLVPPRWLFLKVSTDNGLIGWGEPIVEGKAKTVRACVDEMKDYLIGEDPNNIEDIWQKLYRAGFYRGGPVMMSAISGIDQALWDIKGKRLGVPVYELLGGKVRDKIKVYSWIAGDKPSNVANDAKEKKELGFTAIKMNACEEMDYIDSNSKIDVVLKRVSAIREVCGGDFGIALDFHGRVHKATAKILMKELVPYRLMFIEEPVLAENLDALKVIAQYTPAPIATGERMYSRWDFKSILQAGYVDIVQPDLSHAGGISECKKIAAMAEAYDVSVAPHCPLGPIALASCLQLDTCTHNATLQEQSLGIHYNKGNDLLDYLMDKTVFEYKDSYVEILKKPGLGIDINEEYVRKQNEEPHNWKSPVWRQKDGSIAEW